MHLHPQTVEMKETSAPFHTRRAACLMTMLALLFSSAILASAATVLGPWVPVFKGIDHAVGTNTTTGGGFPHLQVVHFIRVDLTDPDIQIYASPRVTNVTWVANVAEVAGYTTTNFLKRNALQVAVNANSFYTASGGLPSYTASEGSTFNASQLLISRGQVVSSQDSSDDPSVLMFTSNNVATFIATNWPPRSTAGIYTAFAGPYSVLVNGVNVGSNYINSALSIHGLEPRTAYGLSKDRRYLFLLTIDGRQGGYSDGALDWETAAWLLLAGAWDGANMDGGGSTCMVMQDSTGRPVPLNRESSSPAVGRERTVGPHLGVYAKPLPGFFTNIVVLADDTAATVTWSTISPSTTQLRYGPTTNMSLTTPLNSAMVTNHAVLLTNLTPNTEYYYAAVSTIGANQYVSSNLFFMTTNYVISATLFDITNAWRFTTDNLDGVNWKAPAYNDLPWGDPASGMLWADYRGANIDIPMLQTEMPLSPDTGFPYVTYYFRTHFPFAGVAPGVEIQLQAYLDDGAVLYLNGVEIQRLHMAAAPAVINNATLANGYFCATGNATCPEDFAISGPIISTNLVNGDNVLAVEVHNYNAGSPDVTFGLAANCTKPYTLNPRLGMTRSGADVTLSWDRGGFVLQEAVSPAGPWVNVAGPVFTSPFTATNSGATRFFRLAK